MVCIITRELGQLIDQPYCLIPVCWNLSGCSNYTEVGDQKRPDSCRSGIFCMCVSAQIFFSSLELNSLLIYFLNVIFRQKSSVRITAGSFEERFEVILQSSFELKIVIQVVPVLFSAYCTRTSVFRLHHRKPSVTIPRIHCLWRCSVLCLEVAANCCTKQAASQ